MKKLILCFVVLLLSVGLGVLIHDHPAYVFISAGHTTIQTSLWFAIFALIVILLVVRFVIRLLRGIYHIPRSVHHFFSERREKKSQALTQKALCALLEERWDDSEAYFQKIAKQQDYPLFHYLAAAQAAFEQHKEAAANEYLNKAQKIVKPSEVLVLEIMRARWQLRAGNYQQALATLTLLHDISPKHPFVLLGLKETYLALENWKKLYRLLPQLRQHTPLDQTQLDALEERTLSALLEKTGQEKLFSKLEDNWKGLSKKWREKPQLLAIYTKYLIEQNQHAKAEKLLKAELEKNRDAALLEQYACVKSKDPAKQLSRAEFWLKRDPHNPDLLLCLGNLCIRHRLWGKAKTYLELSLKYQSRAQIYPILGEVLEQLDQKQAALTCYKQGLHSLHT